MLLQGPRVRMGLGAFTSVHWRDTKLRARSDPSRGSSDRVSTEGGLPREKDRQDSYNRYGVLECEAQAESKNQGAGRPGERLVRRVRVWYTGPGPRTGDLAPIHYLYSCRSRCRRGPSTGTG